MQWYETFLQMLQDWGYWGMFVAGFISGTVIQLSSEAVLAVLVSQGLDPMKLLVIASSSNWAGSLTTFWIGHLGNLEWIERYFGVTHEKLLQWEDKVDRYGAYFAILGWIPLFGNIIVLALGFFGARKVPTAWWMLVGKTARYAVIIWIFN